jgi:heme iron utilization protein
LSNSLHRDFDPARAKPEPASPGAFSSEVDTGSHEENASKQKPGASVLIQSEPLML